MSINLVKLTQLISYNTQLAQEKAELHQLLSIALSNDAADTEAIADARTKAEQAMVEAHTAKAALLPLQAAIAADISEDEKVNALLDSISFPAALVPEVIDGAVRLEAPVVSTIA